MLITPGLKPSISCMPAHDTFMLTEPIRRLRSRSQEIIKPISSAHEAHGKVLRSRSRYPLHNFARTPVVAGNRRRLEPIVQEERAHFPSCDLVHTVGEAPCATR